MDVSNIKILERNGRYSLCAVVSEYLICDLENAVYNSNEVHFGRPYLILNYKSHKILEISELQNVINMLNNEYEAEKKALESKLQSTKLSDYSSEIERDKNRLKKTIIKVAKNISECDIDFENQDFENNLKEIYQLRKQLYSFSSDYGKDARIVNGAIKQELRKLKIKHDKELTLLNLDSLKNIGKQFL